MASNNPVFGRIDKDIKQRGYAGFGERPTQAGMASGGPQDAMTQRQLEDIYQQPAAGPVQTGRLTYDDVVMKTLGMFGILVVVAAVAWVTTLRTPSLALPIMLGGAIGGLVVAIVVSVKKSISVPLILLYSVLEGGFVGAISQFFEGQYPGIVTTAVVATLATFAGMLVGYKLGIIRVTSKSRRIFGMMLLGYLLFSVVNLVALMFGWTSGWGFGGSGLLGIGISLLGVGLASYSLAMDFDSIDSAVRAGVPEKYSWLLAFGLIVTLVWLYLEILRLLARLRD
ncbi:MAG: Bax inhibitor-1/YccA family protein [Actinomycetota bacterium]|nr:Bax inhibitor-1/YccA family protein [Actinomycetota bacterium]